MKFSLTTLFFGALTATMVSAQDDDIPTTAVNAGSFTTLVAALTAANLVTAISDPAGPFTVFAPSDTAFAGVEEAYPGITGCLLANTDALSSILLYHVVSGTVLSTDLVDGMMPVTLNDEAVTVDLTDGVKINTATVSTPDVMASNGVIHIIDSVLVPPSIDLVAFYGTCPKDIPTTAVNAGSFQTLVAALGAADLVTTLSGEGPFTVFAPSDTAFMGLPEELVPCLLKGENKEVLSGILTYHVAAGKVMSTDLTDGMAIETVQGSELSVDLSTGVMIGTATVTTPDVEATNGVIHVIDSVLVPPGVNVTAFLESCATPMMDDKSPTASPTMPETEDESSASTAFGKMIALGGAALVAMAV